MNPAVLSDLVMSVSWRRSWASSTISTIGLRRLRTRSARARSRSSVFLRQTQFAGKRFDPVETAVSCGSCGSGAAGSAHR